MKVNTMIARILFCLTCICLSFSAQAQLYKWVGADGKVNYSDAPPPANASKVETKAFAVADTNAALPFELAKAVKEMPVTLYTSQQCAACDAGRSFLKSSGIPFSEKTVSTNDDILKIKKLSGDIKVPLLFIGRTKVSGFSQGEWQSDLSQAGYPGSNMLPADYQFSAPQPAVAKAATAAAAQATPAAKPDQPARDPNGFQF